MQLFRNYVLIVTAAAWALSQLAKTVIYLIRQKEINIKCMWGTGGMPSSHSAVVSAVAAATVKVEGAASVMAAVSIILAFIVIRDAIGVRREVGKHAEMLNKLAESGGDAQANAGKDFDSSVGHNFLQALIGIIIGVGTALAIPVF